MSAHSILYRRIIVGFATAVLAVALVAVGPTPRSDAMACSGDVTKTTSSSRFYVAGTLAYWASISETAGGPCSDVNVLALTSTHNCRGAYYSSIQGGWVNGAVGWVYCELGGDLAVVISSLSGTGIDIQTGSQSPSEGQQVLT